MQARKIMYLDSTAATVKDLTIGKAVFNYPQPIDGFGEGVMIAVHSFSYTNFFINIEPPNNEIFYSDDPALPQKYTITIPEGNYGVSDLNDFVQSTVLQQTGLAIFSLVPNNSTGKLSIEFTGVVGWFVNFTATRPPIMGFNVQHVPITDANTAHYSELAPNAAQFNAITKVKVSSDLAQDSIDNSSLSSNIIHVSVPYVSPSSVQVDEPFNLLNITSMKLISSVSNITIQILDQLNRPVKLSEDFSLTLMII